MDGMRKVKPMGAGELPGKLPSKMYPSIHIDFKTLPEAEKWKVGESYNVALVIKQTSVHQDENGGGASFEIRGVKVLNGGSHKRVPRYKA